MDACFQCKLCEVQCPYTPRDGHEFQLDFPKLVHRYRGVHQRGKPRTLRQRVLNDPDTRREAGAPLARDGERREPLRPLRVLMEKTVGVHRDKLLPDFAAEAFDALGREARPREGRSRAARWCSSRPASCSTTSRRSARTRSTSCARNGVDARVVKGLACCGMPAWEHGDLEALRRQARHDLDLLLPYVEQGAKVLVVNPTCSMMMRREWPHLLEGADRARAEKLAPAVMDVSEFLWSIRNEPRFDATFKSAPPGGKVAYHAPCHLRAQAIGFKGRDLHPQDPGRHGAGDGDGVLRPRRHLRDDGGGLRAVAAASGRRRSTG